MTSGGDAPGMNACIRAAVRTACNRDLEPVGIIGAYQGMLDANFRELKRRDVGGILGRGGTILDCGRSDEFMKPEGQDKAAANLRNNGIDSVIGIGGDGTFAGLLKLQDRGIDCIGVPGTIDNDVAFTDMSIGVDTALNTVVWAIDSIRDTAASHHRAFIVEVMGRRSGYLAANAGLATGADMILIPEIPTSFDDVLEGIEAAYAAGKPRYIIVIAEGASIRAHELEDAINQSPDTFNARLTVLGHIQRGGVPSGYDRILAGRLGAESIKQLCDGASGTMVGSDGTGVRATPLEQVLSQPRSVNTAIRELAIALAH